MLKAIATLSLVALLSACATPTVVESKQNNDSQKSCTELKASHDEAKDFEAKARKERGVTGTNVAAALLFWPAMIGTYKNTEDAINAAKERQVHLEQIAASKGCKLF